MKDNKKGTATSCESCLYYDYDEYTEDYGCTVNFEEDDMAAFLQGTSGRCPYYRFYDEYKSVQKQN